MRLTLAIKAHGPIKGSGRNLLGVDKLGRRHWVLRLKPPDVRYHHPPDDDPVATGTRRPRPWPEGFPDVIAHASVAQIYAAASKGQPLDARGCSPAYVAAKAGDAEAATRVVASVLRTALLQDLARAFPSATVVYAKAVEAAGVNKLPHAYAVAIRRTTGLPFVDVTQTNIVSHTGAGALHRLLTSPRFVGEVEPGREYIIIDDVITTGSTLASLRIFLESRGASVVAASSLACADKVGDSDSATLALSMETRQRIEGLLDVRQLNVLLREHGIAEDYRELSNSQGRYLARHSSVDALRDQIARERIRRGRRLDRGELRSDRGGSRSRGRPLTKAIPVYLFSRGLRGPRFTNSDRLALLTASEAHARQNPRSRIGYARVGPTLPGAT